MKRIIAILIASLTGLTVLAGYFFQAQLANLTGLLIEWGILLVGLAGVIGIGYLLKMHLVRVVRWQKGSLLSLIVLVAFLVTVGIGFFLPSESAFFRNWVLNIQIPVETSLLAILAVTMLFASLRIIRTRGWTLMSASFLISALISLILNLHYLNPAIGTAGAEWLEFVRRLPLAGLRGILIGIALGGLIVGLRVLLGMDRPYEDGP
ncbi:MAG TPA: hypothetical protein PK057_06995 [Brevefilum fermentans]|jgi:hypothetical protein|nr:hypothetical protein [Brevefilum fermentans]